MGRAGGDGRQGDHGHAVGHRVRPVARVDHRQVIERQVVQRDLHRGGEPRRVHALALHTQPPAVLDQEQVQLRAGVRAPEVDLIRRSGFDHLLDHVAFQ